MWTRAELKRQAKAGLKQYYWYGVLATLINGAISWGISVLVQFIPLIGFIASPLIGIFVFNVMEVGLIRYFTISTLTGRDAGTKELFGAFKDGRYGNTVKVMFFKNLFQFLWTLLLIVPGVIKHYEYYMVPYLVAEYPEKDSKEIFSLSREMMNGNKFKTFVLELSFVGWMILAVICCGIGLLFFSPYLQATLAELYLRLKEEKLNIPRDNGSVTGSGGMQAERGITYVSAADEGQTRQLGLSGTTGKGFVIGIQGAFSGANVPVAQGEVLVIGSDARQCSLVIQGPEVSPVHIKIVFNGTNFQVTDCSAAGTYDMQRGRLPKGSPAALNAGTYLQVGTGGDIFSLEIR